MARAKKSRRRRHPGVVLIKPAPERRTGWRARFVDADSGKRTWVSLDPALTTRERREDWAVRKSRELAQRRLDLEQGAVRATGTPIADAIERYYTGHPQLRDATLRVYRTATGKLVQWSKTARVRTADDLTRSKLMEFREQSIAALKQVRQGQHGHRVATQGGRRSPHTVNKQLRAVRAVLGYLLDLDLFSKLSHDDLRRSLKRLPAPVERIDYLKPKALQRLLQAAVRHDQDTSTLRPLPPIAPFVAFVLLTGCRFGEAVDLDWEQVDLEALDSTGKPIGEVYITSASKTAKARTVGLEVSPALRKLLIAQKLRTGGRGNVFELTRDAANTAARRLRNQYGAPAGFGWQALRRTCGTYLTNAPGIFGGASAYRSAKQLGHSVEIAERHYLGLERGIPKEATSVEAATQVEPQMVRVIESVGRPARQKTRAV